MEPEIVKIKKDYLTPSVVAFPSDQDGLVIVGDGKCTLRSWADRVIKEVKRDMGTDKTFFAGNEHTPQGISSMILKNSFKTLKTSWKNRFSCCYSASKF